MDFTRISSRSSWKVVSELHYFCRTFLGHLNMSVSCQRLGHQPANETNISPEFAAFQQLAANQRLIDHAQVTSSWIHSALCRAYWLSINHFARKQRPPSRWPYSPVIFRAISHWAGFVINLSPVICAQATTVVQLSRHQMYIKLISNWLVNFVKSVILSWTSLKLTRILQWKAV